MDSEYMEEGSQVEVKGLPPVLAYSQLILIQHSAK
jgi:hypothetical protein